MKVIDCADTVAITHLLKPQTPVYQSCQIDPLARPARAGDVALVALEHTAVGHVVRCIGRMKAGFKRFFFAGLMGG